MDYISSLLPVGVQSYNVAQKIIREDNNNRELTIEEKNIISTIITSNRKIVHNSTIKSITTSTNNNNNNNNCNNIMIDNPNILIITAYSIDYTIGNLCEKVIRKYADYHQYHFISHILPYMDMLSKIHPKLHCTWYKILMINEYLNDNNNKYDYILWIDADAIIIDFNIKIEYFIKRSLGRDILIAEDMNPCCLINAGVILIKNTDWSKECFKQVWNLDRYDNVKFYEQSALVKVLRLNGQNLEKHKIFHTYVTGGIKGDKVFDNVLVVPHTDFNSNCGWLQMSKSGLTKLRRRKDKERIRTLKNGDINNNRIDIINNNNYIDNNNDKDNNNNDYKKDNNNNNNDNDNNDEDIEYPSYIFHAAGCNQKNDALLYMIKKFNIDIDPTIDIQHFKLKRDKLGRPSKYNNDDNNNNNNNNNNSSNGNKNDNLMN